MRRERDYNTIFNLHALFVSSVINFHSNILLTWVVPIRRGCISALKLSILTSKLFIFPRCNSFFHNSPSIESQNINIFVFVAFAYALKLSILTSKLFISPRGNSFFSYKADSHKPVFNLEFKKG